MIVIVSKGKRVHSTRRLCEAAALRGIATRVLSPYKCRMSLLGGQAGLLRGLKPVRLPPGGAAVIPRIGASVTDYGLALINQFESAGFTVLNRAWAFYLARNKMLALQTLSSAGVRVPRTVMSRDREDLEAMAEQVGGFPLVLKLTTGTQGVGVMIAESIGSMRSALDALWGLGQNILVQEYIREGGASDIRVVVVGGRAIASYRRIAPEGEFRSNMHRGAKGERVAPDGETLSMAVKSAAALGLDVAGVDIMTGSEGPVVLEVNASPGLKGVESVTGVDVASAIIDLAVSKAGPGRGRDA
jgi:ribosomal protein S6--L-glutamate ligase